MVGTDLDLTISRRPNDGSSGTTQRTENMPVALPATHDRQTLGEILAEIDPTPPGNDVVSSVCKWNERAQNWRCAGWIEHPVNGWGGAVDEEVFPGNGTMIILRDDATLSGYNPGLIVDPNPMSSFNNPGGA
jgi:hypothetical protein